MYMGKKPWAIRNAGKGLSIKKNSALKSSVRRGYGKKRQVLVK